VTEKTEQALKQPTVDTEAPNSDASDSGASSKTKRSLRALYRTLRTMFIVAVILGMAAAGWLFWQDWQQRTLVIDETSSAIKGMIRSMQKAQHQSLAVGDAQTEQLQQIQQLQQQIQNLQLRVNTQGRRLAELGSTTRSDWLLAEAVYLTRLASQRLQTQRSVKTPLALLENVDIILKELDDPDLLSVRGAVAEDITALRLAGDVDREGIYLELQALANNIEKLPLVDFPAEVSPQQQAPRALQNNEDNIFTGFLRELESLVRIRDRQTPLEPILQPTEELLVRRNFYMMLEQAQVALLREEQVIYDQSLLKAQNYLARFFQYNANAQVAQRRLATLAQANIARTLPRINRSLEALETLLIVRQQRLTETDNAVEVETAQ